jgi:hypothetical protein
VVGVDLAPEMVEEASAAPVELAGRVTFRSPTARAALSGRSLRPRRLQNMIPFFEELGRVTAPAARAIFAFSRGPRHRSGCLPTRFGPPREVGFAEFQELPPGAASPSLPRRTPVRIPAQATSAAR